MNAVDPYWIQMHRLDIEHITLAEPARPVSWAQAEEANTFDLSSICKETPERVCEESYVCHFLEPFGESSVF